MKFFVPYKLQIVMNWIRDYSIFTAVKLFNLLHLKKKYHIFNAKHGYLDNSKYLFEYYVNKGMLCVWVANNTETFDLVKNKFSTFDNVTVKKRGSLSLTYYLCTAKYLFITHNYGDIGKFPKCVTVVNLWHGVALKKMGFDSPNDMNSISSLEVNPYLINDYVISTSNLTATHLASAMQLPLSSVLPFGQPRNDIFSLNNSSIEKLKLEISDLYLSNRDKSDSTQIFLYAPTFRDKPANPLSIYLQVINAFEASKNKNTILVLRLHPNEKPLLDNIRFSERVVLSKCLDVQHDLLAADALISDYSSVVFDYMLTGKPIILFSPDKGAYFNNRGGFYFDYDEVFKHCTHCSKQDEVQKLLDNNSLNFGSNIKPKPSASEKIFNHFS